MSEAGGRSPFQLIFDAFHVVGNDVRRWLPILGREPLLTAFLLVSFVAFNVLLWINLGEFDLPLVAKLIAFPLNWILFHGGMICLMIIARRTTPEPEPAQARHPRVELAGLVVWLVFIAISSYLRAHHQPRVWPASWLTALFAVLDGLHQPLAGDLALLKMLRTFHCLATLPLLFLLLCGNRPGALGFRRPRIDWRGMLVWAALLGLAVAKVAWHRGDVVAGLAGSLFLAGLAEELLFRAGLQTRLEIVLGSPIKAMVVAAPVFALIHLTAPQDQPVWAVANALGAKAMTGLLLGYLYYRTRSLLPGMMLHATFDVALFAGAGAL